jgi:hypothetical protein
LRTLVFFIIVDMRFSSEILPIMSVDTGISCVLSITVRAPYGLEMEHVKVRIFLKFITVQ